VQEKLNLLNYKSASINLEEKKLAEDKSGFTTVTYQTRGASRKNQNQGEIQLENHFNIFLAKKDTLSGVGSQMSLSTFKLLIYEKWELPPLQQKLYHNNKELTDEEKTLKDYEIAPGDTVFVEKIAEDLEILNGKKFST
jgi:hypothetical protein